MIHSSSLIYWNGLAHLLYDRPDLFKLLMDHQPDPKEGWTMSRSALRVLGWPAAFTTEFIERRYSFDLDRALHHLAETEITLLSIHDQRYPLSLKRLAVPPQVLYVRGNLKALEAPFRLSVVGSRHITSYGKEVIRRLLPPVVAAGGILVSGLAYGVDAEVHRVAVDGQRPTIGVLGGGIDDATLHPKCNLSLAGSMLKFGGALISEYPPGTPAQKHRFPQRNRMIAGCSAATLIIEAAERSGSLITARLALEENREVWAVPGNITQPMSAGCNRLIAEGAVPIRTCQELCDRLSLTSVQEIKTVEAPEKNQEAQQILLALSKEPLPVDKLFEICKLNITMFHQTLSQLELDGSIVKEGERISLSISIP